MSAKEETVPTNVESGDAEVAVKALAREKQPVAKNTKEVKANKLAAKAPKKKTSAPNPTYEEKPAAKASKKPAAAKPKAEVVKASRTSSRTSQGKKAADAEPAVVGTEKAPAKREFIWTFPYL
ncbi:unnamed protein product [Eruca vesicaria subsp. sativa]|uniref:Uncharacterized protein n=1 Tax=Eruca vesicaria subsp. sativa TaxID=29727 RepID=A0ABC8KVR4_ERUVS|nr:unnamed protein product [Eruca vesicaria subsp. sativa]